jgi:hypothetical protein
MQGQQLSQHEHGDDMCEHFDHLLRQDLISTRSPLT